MILELEPDGGLEMFELPRPDLDVEPVPLVRDLDDLGPREPVDPQSKKNNNQSIQRTEKFFRI